MRSAVAQIKKLRGRSLEELRFRGRQEIARLGERVLGAGCREMTDRELFRQIDSASRNGNGEGSAMLILGRIRSSLSRASTSAPSFFPSLSIRDEVSAIIRHRFASERQALLERAERTAGGRFDLLGFSDLSFGNPIDWHLDPTTGRRAPLVHWSKIDYLDPNVAGDKKVIWELNRHAHFVTLGQAYWLTGDERFAEAFVSQASQWMDANPPKLGINWASSLEISFRIIAWLWALHLFAESDRLSAKFVSRFFKFLIAQARHVESYLSRYFSPNTHLTGEALGLFYLGVTVPELAGARRFRETGLGVLLDQIKRHIRSDGTYFEQSSYYHRYTVDFYMNLVALARSANIELPGEVEERLSLALDHLMWITRPDGSSPFYGDDDGGRLLTLNARPACDFRDTLATGAALLARTPDARASRWKFVAGQAPIETLWLLGPGALAAYDEISASAPREKSRAFAEGGCFVMRDGWSRQSSYVAVDCGPHGSSSCGHAHADALAFEYAVEGKTWLADPGTFTYTGDASLRDQFRSTAAHNTVMVDGEQQSAPAGPFAWNEIAASRAKEFITGEAFDYFEGSHDGYERLDDPVTHTRSVLFLKPSACGRDGRAPRTWELPPLLIVRDRFNARARHRYALRYHFAADCSAKAHDNEVTASDEKERELRISVFGKGEITSRIEEGWVSRCYGQRKPAPVAVFEADADGPQEFVSIITLHCESGSSPCTGGPLWPPLIEEAQPQEGAATEGRPYKAPYKASRCSVQIEEGRIEITIHRAGQDDLSFNDPPTKIVVNDSSFQVLTASRAASFALEGSNWRLTREDSN